MPKTLVIFDVDMTISQGILQEALFVAMHPEIKALEFQKGFKGQQSWTQIISRALQNHPPKVSELQEYLARVPLVNGMKQTFNHLQSIPQTTLVIFSGGSDLLVRKYLETHHCLDYFQKVFANQLSYDQQQKKYGYHPIESKCRLSTCINCKATSLKMSEFIKDYEQVFYVGDGLNDLCGMSLLVNGCAFIRKDKQIDKKTKKVDSLLSSISVPVKYWMDGYHLADQIKSLF